MAKTTRLLALLLAPCLAAVARAAPADPTGAWRSPDGARAMRVACEAGICRGVLVKGPNPEATGRVVLRDLKPAGAVWKGLAVLPEREREVAVEVERRGRDTLRLTAGSGLWRRTREWTRIP